MHTFVDFIITLFLTYLLSSLTNALIADFVLTIRFDKKMLMTIINSCIFLFISNNISSHDKNMIETPSV
jgi:hypothetical protein